MKDTGDKDIIEAAVSNVNRILQERDDYKKNLRDLCIRQDKLVRDADYPTR